MSVKLHQPVAGQDAGSTYTGPMEAWLVANGYASDSTGTDKVNVTGVAPDLDPQLADNREAPGEPFAVKGEPVGEPALPVEDPASTGRRTPAPQDAQRDATLGAPESKESKAATRRRDGRVFIAPLGTPAVQLEATRTAEAAGNVDHTADEPATA